jgi:hypothetical protein
MQVVLIWIARSAGIAGVLVMVLAVLVRLSGDYWLGGFQVGTILQAGMAMTLVACLGYIAALVERTKP